MTHPLRRDDLEISDRDTIHRILSEARYATAALTDGDTPYAVTLSCGFDEEAMRLYFHVAKEGRKLDVIARNPRACVSVVDDLGYNVGKCEHPYRSVVMEGRMRVVTDPSEMRAGMRTLIGQLESASDAERIFLGNALDDDAALGRFRMLAFEIEKLSAKTGK
jgi:uncharacterized protein